VAPGVAGSIEIQEFGFQATISEAVLSMFVLLAIDSIVERAVGEAIGVIPRLSADHPFLISVSIGLFAAMRL
jgi:hypothetical protein